MNSKSSIRVLVVDDSLVVRRILVSMLQSEPGMEVAGEARDGSEAVELATRLRPDVITMDIRMPRLDGLEAIRQIMATVPTPIVVLANNIYDADLNIAFSAIAAGALTVVEKPRGLGQADYEAVRQQLIQTLRLMADVPVITVWLEHKPPVRAQVPSVDIRLVAMAASTGGPGVLKEILAALPGDFPLPIVVVQHITIGFVHGFVKWLDGATALRVKVAEDGDRAEPGLVLVAPDDQHITVAAGGLVQLDGSPPLNSVRPSATVLFASAASAYGGKVLAVVLSGMGEDGADGLVDLRQAGGYVVAQDEQTCAVFGMPKVAIERGLVDQVLSPDRISTMLLKVGERRSTGPLL